MRPAFANQRNYPRSLKLPPVLAFGLQRPRFVGAFRVDCGAAFAQFVERYVPRYIERYILSVIHVSNSLVGSLRGEKVRKVSVLPIEGSGPPEIGGEGGTHPLSAQKPLILGFYNRIAGGLCTTVVTPFQASRVLVLDLQDRLIDVQQPSRSGSVS